MQTQGAQANSSERPGPSWKLNPESSCCEATVLTTAPSCHPWFSLGGDPREAVLLNKCTESQKSLFKQLFNAIH